jgi:transcriptional regulator with XRE-family HTH domain
VQHFRTTLRAWLDDRGWNYSDLERATGINNSVISRWFATPPRRPTPENLERLAKATGVPYQNWLRLCGYLPQETDGETTAQHDPEEAEILALFRDVPEESRTAAKHMLRGLAVQPTGRLINRPKRRVVNDPRKLGPRDPHTHSEGSNGEITGASRTRHVLLSTGR